MQVMAPRKTDRHARIKDPRQRVLAQHVGEICDLFSEHLSPLPPAKRLMYGGEKSATWPSSARTLAIGAVVSMGRSLGLPMQLLFGQGSPAKKGGGCGYTEIEELHGLHYTTILTACQRAEALMQDRGEVGLFVAKRYNQILTKCRRALREYPPEDIASADSRLAALREAERERYAAAASTNGDASSDAGGADAA